MNELVHETMQTFNEFIVKLSAGSLTIANLLRGEQIDSALDQVSQFSEGLQWVLDITTHLRQLGYEKELDVTLLNPVIEEISDALTKKDYLLAADLFEYEMSVLLKAVEPYSIVV